MYTVAQRRDYDGGELINPSQGIIRLRKNPRTDQTWFELLAEFLEQPNVNEVQALSIGWWLENDYRDATIEELDLRRGDFHIVVESLTNSAQYLESIKFIFLGDFFDESGKSDFNNLIKIQFPIFDINSIFRAFPKLEYFGVYGFEIDYMDLMKSNSIKSIEIRIPKSLDAIFYQSNFNYSPLFDLLSNFKLPELKVIHLFSDPYIDCESEINEIYQTYQKEKFPHLYFVSYEKAEKIQRENNEIEMVTSHAVHVFQKLENHDNLHLKPYYPVVLNLTTE